ncbi:hypothetical protein EB796_001613 [Bugula neritina]|uniref:Uncharacterized protein n=1 Tax=Bugula neritina TaxID=10212 RepID=A0A7J7KPH7_BUGNE|nr:hypothetical protein EB796_001613 [Bugula neritina]
MAETLKELQKKIEELEKKAAEAESPKKIGKRKAVEDVNGDKTRNESQSLIPTEDSSVKGDDDDEYLLTKELISLNNFTYFNDKENTIVAYKHAKKFYMKSDEYIGELKVYESSLANAGPCLYVKKSMIMENTKAQLSKLINKQIKFYGKKEKATLLGCFVSTVRNVDNEMCVNALVNNKAMLLPVKDLFGRVSKLTAVLQSGNIKKVNDEWLWSLTVKEIKLDDVKDGEMAYFKRTEPQIKFLA